MILELFLIINQPAITPLETPTIEIAQKRLTIEKLKEIDRKLSDALKKKQQVTKEQVSSWLGFAPKNCDGNTAYQFCIWKEGKQYLKVEWQHEHFGSKRFVFSSWQINY